MDWKNTYKEKCTTPEKVAAAMPENPTVFASPSASFPAELVNAVTARADIGTMDLYSALVMTLPDFLTPEQAGRVRYHSAFMGPLERMFLPQGCITPISMHFSRLHELAEYLSFDACIFDVSPPDENGYMSLGPSGTLVGRPVIDNTKRIFCQVNKQTPYVYGDRAHVHVSEVELLCEVDRPPFALPPITSDVVEAQIADLIVERIPDGATIQLGIGKLADAIGERLTEKKDLGIHTELLTPSMVKLYEMGVVTGKHKDLHPGKIISAFGMGTAKDYQFMHKNPVFEQYPAEYVNDPNVIAKHKNFVSINNALAVDLTGQVSSESVGFSQHSATGGQLDFVRGARLSKGGQSFIAMKSVSGKGEKRFSRIQLTLPPGTAVTTPRSDVQNIVTEYGIANLAAKSLPERVVALIRIAHPDFRESLAKQAVEAGLIAASEMEKAKISS